MRYFLALCVCSLALMPKMASAKYVGPDPPKGCPTSDPRCTSAPLRTIAFDSIISATKGNLIERVPVSKVTSTLTLDFVYNTYNADGSRATVDTVMGYGWTHSYNIFLFSQAGVMFRWDGDGRVTRYGLSPGGTFVSSPGYFETLTQSGGVFTIAQKDASSGKSVGNVREPVG